MTGESLLVVLKRRQNAHLVANWPPAALLAALLSVEAACKQRIGKYP